MWVETTALFFHVLGALLLTSGAAVAGASYEVARRRHASSEIALLLGMTRLGVALVGTGGLVVLGFGLWLVELASVGFDAAWIQATLALFALTFLLGALGGRRPKQARLLAERLAREQASARPRLPPQQ